VGLWEGNGKWKMEKSTNKSLVFTEEGYEEVKRLFEAKYAKKASAE
jgi:hypothetical protein